MSSLTVFQCIVKISVHLKAIKKTTVSLFLASKETRKKKTCVLHRE